MVLRRVTIKSILYEVIRPKLSTLCPQPKPSLVSYDMCSGFKVQKHEIWCEEVFKQYDNPI